MKAAELMVAHPGLLMVAAHTIALCLPMGAAGLDLRTEDVLHLLTVAAGPGRLTVDGRLLMAGAVQEGRQVVAEVVVTVVADTAAATRRVGAAEDIPVAAVAGTAVATN